VSLSVAVSSTVSPSWPAKTLTDRSTCQCVVASVAGSVVNVSVSWLPGLCGSVSTVRSVLACPVTVSVTVFAFGWVSSFTVKLAPNPSLTASVASDGMIPCSSRSLMDNGRSAVTPS